MIRVFVIGIGSGVPDQLTGEAVAAMREVDLFLVADKGGAERDLAEARRELCRQVIENDRYRIVAVPDPLRDRSAAAYESAVRDWHAARATAYAEVISRELGATGTVGFLVWGDPAFYDSTIRIAESLASAGLEIELRVIPGISSMQLLAARHAIVLNRIGQPIQLTTGRRLAEDFRSGSGDLLVWLDGDLACEQLAADHPELTIFWGAQLGLPDEALISGRLGDVMTTIRARRTAIREIRGWVLDLYLLRRRVRSRTRENPESS